MFHGGNRSKEAPFVSEAHFMRNLFDRATAVLNSHVDGVSQAVYPHDQSAGYESELAKESAQEKDQVRSGHS